MKQLLSFSRDIDIYNTFSLTSCKGLNNHAPGLPLEPAQVPCRTLPWDVSTFLVGASEAPCADAEMGCRCNDSTAACKNMPSPSPDFCRRKTVRVHKGERKRMDEKGPRSRSPFSARLLDSMLTVPCIFLFLLKAGIITMFLPSYSTSFARFLLQPLVSLRYCLSDSAAND